MMKKMMKKMMIGLVLVAVAGAVSADLIGIDSTLLGNPSTAQLESGWSVTNYNGVSGLNFTVTLSNPEASAFSVGPGINASGSSSARVGESTYNGASNGPGTFTHTLTFDFSGVNTGAVTLVSLAWDLTQAITVNKNINEEFDFSVVGGGTFDLTTSDTDAVITGDGTASVNLAGTAGVSGVTGLTSGTVSSFAIQYSVQDINTGSDIANWYGVDLNYTTVVPEPATVGLFSISSVSLLLARKLFR